ncbi:hypothetical protein MPER_02257, partial [Moniliophthora perniciosa FA553]
MGTPLRKVHTENWDSFRESYHSTHSPLRVHKQEKEDDTKEREERAKKDRDTLGPHLASLTEHVRKLESENVRMRADLGVLKARDQSIQVLNEEKKEAEPQPEVHPYTQVLVPPMAVDEADTPTVEETAALAALRIDHAKLLEEYGVLQAELAGLRSSSPIYLFDSGKRQRYLDDSSFLRLEIRREVGLI